MLDWLQHFWPYLTAGIILLLQIMTAGHCLIYKRDSRAATAWTGLILLAPLLGSFLYILLGINRVRRRATGMRGEEATHVRDLNAFVMPLEQLAGRLPHDAQHLIEMARVNTRVTALDLLGGNRVEPLHNGDEAYPAMLAAIESAQQSITLCTYIFDNDRIGRQFVEALAAAVDRGVETRVLIDSVGARYSLPPITHRLRTRGVRTARFLPSLLPLTTPYLNLRNHRKIMVVDGSVGFTGGMNIRGHHVLADGGRHATRDLHFRVTGPVVHELQATFVEDWHFTTQENLSGERWFATPQSHGDVLARAVPDGPDKDYDKMRMAFHGALSVAQRYVRIVTPYFLPDASLVGALNTCAMRGVAVDIVLPEHNNLKLVAWASMAQMWQLLEMGCRIWLTPPPFDHSKILVMDDYFSLIGSSNWDPRSLRLNFEIGLECYDDALARQLNAAAQERISRARPLTLDEVNGRGLPVQLRDGAARLLAPYL